MGCRSTCSGGFGGTAWINKLPLPILLIQVCEWSVCEWHVISCLVVFVYSTWMHANHVLDLCRFWWSLRRSCGGSVWANDDCLRRHCFRRSRLISAGVSVCIKASYSRFVCTLAAIFVCFFAEGMDEKTAIFQARRRWHTWPVKHALHFPIQLLPRLWRVGARACRWRDAQPVKERRDSSKTCGNYSALIDQRRDSSITLTRLYTEYEVCCWWRTEVCTKNRIPGSSPQNNSRRVQWISEKCPLRWIMIAACSVCRGSFCSPVGRFDLNLLQDGSKAWKDPKQTQIIALTLLESKGDNIHSVYTRV